MTDEKFAFKMRLHPGRFAEYGRRHDEIWPELIEALKMAGIRDYSIHFDEQTNILFATMWRRKTHGMAELAKSELMQKWWAYMADIMETHPDNEPVATPLKTVFHME
jgi:L-rhamnose mutarotase